jgi:hypothetical protein
MSSGTTSIDQLPVNPQGNSQNTPVQQPSSAPAIPVPTPPAPSENIKVENYGQQLELERKTDGASNIPQIDYTSQLTSALKEATASGATVLPSRDIPQQTLGHQHDDHIKPGFVAGSESNDYIGNILDREKIIQDSQRKQNHADNLDYIYQSLQLPILVGVIYFLFQLPIVRKNLLTFLPNLFNKDGSAKLSGYIFNSLMFASLYTLLVKGILYLQD